MKCHDAASSSVRKPRFGVGGGRTRPASLAVWLVLVALSGGCGSFGQVCFDNGDCPGSNAFCAFEVGECAADATFGICSMRPDVCTEAYIPVCGCDGVTYANECAAEMAGVSVIAEGECAS